MTNLILDSIYIGESFRWLVNSYEILDQDLISKLNKGYLILTPTNNFRGYVVNFLLEDNLLYIKELHANLANIVEIDGILPEKKETNSNLYSYSNLNIKSNFTGPVMVTRRKYDPSMEVMLIKNGHFLSNLTGITVDWLAQGILELLSCWLKLSLDDILVKYYFPEKVESDKYIKISLKKLISSNLVTKSKNKFKLSELKESLLIKEIYKPYLIKKISKKFGTGHQVFSELWIKWEPILREHFKIEREDLNP